MNDITYKDMEGPVIGSKGSYTDLSKTDKLADNLPNLGADNQQSMFGTIATIAVGVGSMIAQLWNTSKTNKQNKELYYEERSYNDPSKQYQRLVNAGINPAGQSFSNTIAQTNPTQQQSNNNLGSLGMSIPNSVNEILMGQKNRELADAQIRKTNSEAELNEIDSQTRGESNLLGLDALRSQLKMNDKTIEEIGVKIETMLGNLDVAQRAQKLSEDRFNFDVTMENMKYELDKQCRIRGLDQQDRALAMQLCRISFENLRDAYSNMLTQKEMEQITKNIELMDAQIDVDKSVSARNYADATMSVVNPALGVFMRMFEWFTGVDPRDYQQQTVREYTSYDKETGHVHQHEDVTTKRNIKTGSRGQRFRKRFFK